MDRPLHLQEPQDREVYKRARPNTQPIPNFRPQPGDVIIREIRYPSPQPLNLNGKLELYTDELNGIHATNHENTVNTIFASGDLLLRHGVFATDFKWQYAREAAVYIFWKQAYEQFGQWYKVASRTDPVNNRSVKPDWADRVPRVSSPSRSSQPPSFASSNALDSFGFWLYRGDYVITQQANAGFDVPWSRNILLNIVPSTYDARTAGRDFGAGDILVRAMVTESRGNVPDKSITIEAHGVFNMGEFQNWKYMGRQDAVFKKGNADGSGSGSPSSQARARLQGPVRPGDIIFNPDEELLGPTTSGTWMGGHVLIQPGEGSLPHRPENFPRSILLRLGKFQTDPPPHWTRAEPFWHWVDGKMEMYIHDVHPGSWSKTPINVRGTCPGGMFPICNADFESLGHIRDRPIRVGSEVNIVPTETDIIFRCSNLPEEIPERGDMDEDMWKIMVQSAHMERQHQVFFYEPTMNIHPGDNLFRFGSQPADPEQGQWILSVEMYLCTLSEYGRPSEWRLLGRDVVIFPSPD